MKALRWKKIRPKNYGKAREFLKARENRYVSACARFLHIKDRRDEVWALASGSDEPYSALLLYYRESLYPIFGGCRDIPLPPFLDRIIFKVPVHSIQGPREDVEILEELVKGNDYNPAEQIDYDLMSIDEKPPLNNLLGYGPPDLILRPPEKKDIDEIYILQSAYEQEEVLPKGADFYPAACRTNLERILKSEEMLLACLGPQIAGKINTNAKSFSRYQIGGVYVRPECRGRGIAVRMTTAFIDSLINKGSGAALFVKKNNARAKAVYDRVGFKINGNYRISYF